MTILPDRGGTDTAEARYWRELEAEGVRDGDIHAVFCKIQRGGRDHYDALRRLVGCSQSREQRLSTVRVSVALDHA